MQINCSNDSFIEMLGRLFTTEKKEDGHCNKIPLFGNHITINNVAHFFGDDSDYILEYNEYGQMIVTRNGKNHIIFDVKDVIQISFRSYDEMGKINPKTDNFYTDIFTFKF